MREWLEKDYVVGDGDMSECSLVCYKTSTLQENVQCWINTKTKGLVTLVQTFNVGDYVCWEKPGGIWHHAILEDTQKRDEMSAIEFVEGRAVRIRVIDVDLGIMHCYRVNLARMYTRSTTRRLS